MERLLVNALKKNHLGTRSAERHTPVIVQSFSPESLRKLSGMLNPKVALVLLIDADMRASWLTPTGFAEAKKFASGIGPAKALLDKDMLLKHTLSA